MKWGRLLAVAATLVATAAAAQGPQGMVLEEGETVIAANVQTGAKFTAIVRPNGVSGIFYVNPDGVHFTLLKMNPLVGGQCTTGWTLECHQASGQPYRICFCGSEVDGKRLIDTTTGEVVW